MILFLIIFQIFLFFKTYKSIRSYKKSLIEIDKVSIIKAVCPKDCFQETDISKLKQALISHQGNNDGTTLNLIYQTEQKKSKKFQEILDNINDYIILNQNNFLDFSLIEKMVERSIAPQEEFISNSLRTPMYLGIFSLVFSSIFFEDEIQIFLIPTLLGFSITLLSSNVIYKNAKKDIANKKNDLFNFIQIHLLPRMNQNIPAIINSFQKKMVEFSQEFQLGIDKISVAFTENTKAIDAQKAVFEAIGSEKILSITTHNTKVFQQLQESSSYIESLNAHLSNMDTFVANSQALIHKTNDVLEKTTHVEDIARAIKKTLQENQQILQFLSVHLNHLQDYKTEVHHKIMENDQKITDLFQGLLEHIKETSINIRQFTVDEYQSIKDALSSDKEFFKQLNELTAIRELLSSYMELQGKNPSISNNKTQ